MRGNADFIHLQRMREQCGVLLADLTGQALAAFTGSRLLYDATVLRLSPSGKTRPS